MKKDVELILTLAKTIAFLGCLAACLYEVIRAYRKLKREELGSKTEVVSNEESILSPEFVICFKEDNYFNNKCINDLNGINPHDRSACELDQFTHCLFR